MGEDNPGAISLEKSEIIKLALVFPILLPKSHPLGAIFGIKKKNLTRGLLTKLVFCLFNKYGKENKPQRHKDTKAQRHKGDKEVICYFIILCGKMMLKPLHWYQENMISIG